MPPHHGLYTDRGHPSPQSAIEELVHTQRLQHHQDDLNRITQKTDERNVRGIYKVPCIVVKHLLLHLLPLLPSVLLLFQHLNR